MSNKTEIDRRKFILAAGTAALAAAAPNVKAEDKHHHHHHGPQHKGLTSASADCTETGNACVAHCFILLGQGDKEMAECAQSVNLMLSMCNAVGVHAASDSKYLKDVVTTCKSICEDCEKTCRQHEKHAECKACGDSCADMVSACNDYLKTA